MPIQSIIKSKIQYNRYLKTCLLSTTMLIGAVVYTDLALAQQHTFDLKVVIGEPIVGDEDKTIISVNNFFLLNDGGVIINGALSVMPTASEFTFTTIFALSPAGQFSSIVKATDTYLVDGGPRLEGLTAGGFSVRPGGIFVNRDTGLVTFEVFGVNKTLKASVGQAVTPVLNDYFIPPLNPGIEPALLPNSLVAAINNSGQFLIRVDSSPYGPSPNFPMGSLFLGQPDGSFSTIAELGVSATGIPGGATFTAFFTENAGKQIDFIKDGAIFFSAQYGINGFGFNSFWSSTGSGLNLIAYEDMPTPGITEGTLLDLQFAQPINNNQAVIFGNILPQGTTRNDSYSLPKDTFSNGLWVGSSLATLSPIALVVSGARLTNKINTLGKTAFFDEIELLPLLPTLTSLGNITFLDLDAPVVGSKGTLYFKGTGRIDGNIGVVGLNDKVVEGIWKWDPLIGDVSLAVETSFALNIDNLEFQSATPLLVDPLGGLVFSTVAIGNIGANEPLWYLSNEGSVVNIAGPGDVINGMTVVTAEALHFNDNGILATKILFEDFTGDSVDDQTFFAVTLDIPAAQDVGDHFTVSETCPVGVSQSQATGGTASCGGEWHTRLWEEVETKDGVNFVPGTVGHTDVKVTIVDTAITLENGAVSLRSLHLTGSFEVNSTLDLAQDSNIANLILNADLTTDGILTLTGDNTWKSGTIGGSGKIVLEEGNLDIDILGAPRELETTLSVSGEVNQSFGTLNLTSGGKIDVTDGTYKLADGGKIIGSGPTTKLILQNFGEFIQKAAIGKQSTLGGIIDVAIEADSGVLTLNENAALDINQSGIWNDIRFDPLRDSHLTFNAAQTFTTGITSITTDQEEILNSVVIFNDKISVIDNGILLLRYSDFTLVGDIDVSQGSLLIENETEVIWMGGIITGGVFNDAENIDFGLINKGELIMGADIPDGGYRLNGVINNQELFTISHDLTMGEQAYLSNQRALEIESNVTISAAAGAIAFLKNTDLIEKPDAGNASIEIALTQIGGNTIASDARIIVGDSLNNPSPASLTLRNHNVFFGRNSLQVKSLATLNFNHPGKETTFYDRTIISGFGDVKFTAGDFIIKNGAALHDFANLILDGGSIMVENTGVILFYEEGIFNWKKGTISHSPTRPFATIGNSGEMNITGAGPHVMNNVSIANSGQLTISGNITGTASTLHGIAFGSVIIMDNQNAPIDVGVRLNNSQELQVAYGTEATFSGVVDQFTSNILKGGILRGGRWIINNEAELTLTTTTSGSSDISTIRDLTFVELRGNGKFNNLTNVSGDLDIRDTAQLHLRDVNNFNVADQLNIYLAGELRLFNSKINVDGDFEMGSNLLDTFGFSIFSRLEIDSRSKVTIGEDFEVLSAGIVTINGVLTAAVLDIKNGGSFDGSGTINGKIINSGTGSPGNSPGILTINGDYVQSSTGTLNIEIGGTEPGTEYDQLIVNGTSTFEEGAKINVEFISLEEGGEEFRPRTGDTFDFLMSDELVLNEGTEIGDYLNFLNMPNGLSWEYQLVTINGIASWQLMSIFGTAFSDIKGLSGNLLNVGMALDTATTSEATDGLIDLALAIEGLGNASTMASLGQSGFNFASSMFDLTSANTTSMIGPMRDRLDDILWGGSMVNPSQTAGFASPNQLAFNQIESGRSNNYGALPMIAAMAQANGSAGQMFGYDDGFRFGLSINYERGSFDASANQQAFDYDGYSMSLQAEYGDLKDGLIVGVSVGYSDLSGTTADNLGNLESKSFGAGLYGSAKIDNMIVVDATVFKSWGDLNSERRVEAGTESFTALGSTDSSGLNLSARISVPMELGGIRLAPFASIEYDNNDVDGFNEISDSDGALSIASAAAKNTYSQIGASFATGKNENLQLRFSTAWEYSLSQTAPGLSANFAGAPSHNFAILTDKNSKNAVRLSARIGKNFSHGWRVGVSYNSRIASDRTNHSMTAKASLSF